jgi:hypothetical protein
VSAFGIHAQQNHIRCHSLTQSRHSQQSLYPEKFDWKTHPKFLEIEKKIKKEKETDGVPSF